MKPNHQTILSLARAGNPVRAWSLFRSSGLGEIDDDAKVLTLKGRLLKDLARRAQGADRSRLYSEASDAYFAANALGRDSYPLINAAALACFAGDHARAGAIANDVLSLIQNNPNEGETAYWREATRAEAHLLLGSIGDARSALALAYKRLPFAHEDQAATLGQFDRIIEAQNGDPGWLEPFRVPSSVSFVSAPDEADEGVELSSAIREALEALAPGYGFGCPTSVADLLFAEQVLEYGADLSLVLPFEHEYVAKSVFCGLGQDWEARFDAVVASASQLEVLPSALAEELLPAPIAYEVSHLVAMGQSLRRSEALRSRAHAMFQSGSGDSSPLSLSVWAKSGLAVHALENAGSVFVPPVKPSQASGLCGLVLLDDPYAFAGFDTQFNLKPIEWGERTFWQGDLDEVLGAALQCASYTESAAMSVHLGHPRSQVEWDGLIDRMTRLARAENPAKIKMGFQSAMIAKVLRPSLRIEELGEIQTLSGPASIWAALP